MATEPGDMATVMGGTGFLGRRVVRELAATGFAVRAASRHPNDEAGTGVSAIRADIRDRNSIRNALRGSRVAVNAVSLYVESGGATFEAVHVHGAADFAGIAAEEGVERVVHVSGVGSDRQSDSAYVAARGLGEDEVRQACPAATIVRPCVMFGEGDAFISTFERIVRMSPVFPLFGNGQVRMQPVHAGDVAAAISRIGAQPDGAEPVYEFGGPETLTYAEIVSKVAEAVHRKPVPIPVSVVLWRSLAAMSSPLKSPPITEGQVALLASDNVTSGKYPGIQDLGLPQTSIGEFLAQR